jgi:hypothetical protein
MSNGIFLNANYTANDGTVHRIRIQPETAALVVDGVTNTIPGIPGDGLSQPRARVSGGKSQYGLTVRTLGLKFPPSPVGGYAPFSVVYVPWLNPDTFPDPAEAIDATYQGNSVTVIGSSPERKR